MNDSGYTLELYANDELLAVLDNIVLVDWPWHTCDIKPTAAFDTYRQIFENEYPLWLKAHNETTTIEEDNERHSNYEKIARLKLSLKLISDGKPFGHKGLLFHTDGKKAYFRAMFVPLSE